MTIFGRQWMIQTLPVGFWLAVGAVLLVGACQTTSGSSTGSIGSVERAWLTGLHQIPTAARRDGLFHPLLLGKDIRSNPQDWQRQVGKTRLKPGTKLPAVIYLHGCARNDDGDVWSDYFSDLGYAFFAPNSFVGPRSSTCGSWDILLSNMRQEEAKYALRQLRKADWIDQNRIILMGHSQGGQAVSDYNGREFAAIVLTGTDCRHSGDTPNAPSDVPVLTMVGANDTLLDRGCNISRTIGGSRYVLIKGGGHRLSGWPQAREALEQFLNECCTKPQ